MDGIGFPSLPNAQAIGKAWKQAFPRHGIIIVIALENRHRSGSVSRLDQEGDEDRPFLVVVPDDAINEGLRQGQIVQPTSSCVLLDLVRLNYY